MKWKLRDKNCDCKKTISSMKALKSAGYKVWLACYQPGLTSQHWRVKVLIGVTEFYWIPSTQKYKAQLYKGAMEWRKAERLNEFINNAVAFDKNKRSSKATDKQIKFIKSLTAKSGVYIDINAVKTKQQASKLIKQLLSEDELIFSDDIPSGLVITEQQAQGYYDETVKGTIKITGDYSAIKQIMLGIRQLDDATKMVAFEPISGGKYHFLECQELPKMSAETVLNLYRKGEIH